MFKTPLLLTLALATAALLAPVAAQTPSKQLRKERTELRKSNEKELNQRATKSARKEAKRLAKEGWTVAPGTLPLEKQLDRTYLMQYEFTDATTPAYIMGNGMSTAGNYDAAKLQAMELAKFDLISQLQSDITAMVENTVANDQLSESEAASVTRTVMASKNVMSQKLGRLTPVLETYRPAANGNKEVLVRIAYSLNDARKMALGAVRDELSARGDTLHTRIDALLSK